MRLARSITIAAVILVSLIVTGGSVGASDHYMDDVAKVSSYIHEHSDVFDTVAVNQPEADILVLVTERATEEQLATVRSLVGDDVELRFRFVKYSRDEIRAAADVASDLIFGDPPFEGLAGMGSENLSNGLEFDIRCDRVDELAAVLEPHLPADMLHYEPFGDCEGDGTSGGPGPGELPDSDSDPAGNVEPLTPTVLLVLLFIAAFVTSTRLRVSRRAPTRVT